MIINGMNVGCEKYRRYLSTLVELVELTLKEKRANWRIPTWQIKVVKAIVESKFQ
jgi:hypothetical protein